MEEFDFSEQKVNQHTEGNEEYRSIVPEEKISRSQAGVVALLFAVMFITAGFVIKSIYLKPTVVRTAAEREIVKYKQIIDNEPNKADPYVALAGIYIESGEPEKAITELGRALDLDSRSWKANFEMGVAYEALKDYDLAIAYYKKASEINPNNEYPYYQLGRLYQKQGALKTAITAYKKTLSLNPNLADAHYNIGVCYEKTGDKELAKTEYIEALKYIKDYKEARAALKRLE